jgi:DNA-binding transcriptional LysR family regulator
MTLHQLRIFESVARHRNITRASQELHMSQPAVSQQLKLLEQQCETRFVMRSNQGVELPNEDELFLMQSGLS